jgi:hypothetical protein
MSATRIIIIKKSALDTLLKNLSDFTLIVSIFGIGWALKSEAMQWFGFFLAAIVLIAGATKDSKKLSIEEARAKIDEIEAGMAKVQDS